MGTFLKHFSIGNHSYGISVAMIFNRKYFLNLKISSLTGTFELDALESLDLRRTKFKRSP